MSNQFYFFVPCVFCIQLRTLALDLKVLMIKVELQVDTKTYPLDLNLPILDAQRNEIVSNGACFLHFYILQCVFRFHTIVGYLERP